MNDEPTLEIVVSPTAGFSADGDGPLASARAAFTSLADTLKDAVLPLQKALAESAPDELELRLDLAFKGEAKWVVISTGAGATVAIKLVWKRK